MTASDEQRRYLEIVTHYEACLKRHGDSHMGVDWPNAVDARTRYRVMLDLLANHAEGKRIELLDFGCGAAHLLDFIRDMNIENIDYSGLDISPKYVKLCEQKYPNCRFYCLDILDSKSADKLPRFDYVVLNGVFTEKCDLSFDEMMTYFSQMLPSVFGLARIGMAFNVMSHHVDWERDDLFHLPFDTLAKFLKQSVSPHFKLRQDYGLHEYTCYVYREAKV